MPKKIYHTDKTLSESNSDKILNDLNFVSKLSKLHVSCNISVVNVTKRTFGAKCTIYQKCCHLNLNFNEFFICFSLSILMTLFVMLLFYLDKSKI